VEEATQALMRVIPDLKIVLDDGSTAPHLIIQDYLSQQSIAVEQWTAPLLFIADSSVELSEVVESLSVALEEGLIEISIEIQSTFAALESAELMSILSEPKPLVEIGRHLDEFDDLTNADLVVEQIETADVVLLVRSRTMEGDLKSRVINVIEWLSPRAQIVEAENLLSDSPFPSFELETMLMGAGWFQLIAGTHPQPNRGAGISGFAFRARRPFHPVRFLEVLEYLSTQNVIRARGLIWVASRNDEAGHLLQAGRAALMANSGAWWAATPMREWPDDPIERDEIMADWIPPYGDRQQEFSIIGLELQELEIRRKLKQALLTDEEFEQGPVVWSRWEDPLPDWSPIAEESESDPYLN
jgi:G3E family GTPase